jgi:hypothetical protein
MDDLDDIQRKVDAMGFRGGNEYDLTVREEIADYIQKNFIKKAEHPLANKPTNAFWTQYQYGDKKFMHPANIWSSTDSKSIVPQIPKGGIFPRELNDAPHCS